MTAKKTLVLGVSSRPGQYSHEAVLRLIRAGHPVVGVGRDEFTLDGIQVTTTFPIDKDVHTVTLYLNPERQTAYIDSILQLHPKRIIFNPGTENPILLEKAREAGIEAIEACTLVLLSIGNY